MARWTKERDSCSRCQDLQLLILLREGGLWHGADAGVKGRVAVLGSSSMFDDAWLGHYNNTALLDWLLTWLQQVHDTSMCREPAIPHNMAQQGCGMRC